MKKLKYYITNFIDPIVQNSPFWTNPVGWCSILTFHRVVERKTILPGIEINFKDFKNIIEYLRESDFDIISIDELNNILRQGVIPKRKKIVLTFDDGYIDNYNVVYPFLSEQQIPFTIYVCNGLINKAIYIWWYLILSLYESENKVIIIDNRKVKLEPSNRSIIFKFLKSQNEDSLKFLLSNLGIDIKKSNKLFKEEIAMTWAQISKMAESEYVTIGAHTINHYSLKYLSDESSFDEMLLSKNEIEKHIKRKVSHFAYPFGSDNEVSERELVFAKEIGFETAVTTRESNLNDYKVINFHSLSRIPINGNSTLDEFKLRINGTYGFLNKIINKLWL
jgi:peptidoglycan/xylan/chitin deacetylase (PgdA/CDA1 family)